MDDVGSVCVRSRAGEARLELHARRTRVPNAPRDLRRGGRFAPRSVEARARRRRSWTQMRPPTPFIANPALKFDQSYSTFAHIQLETLILASFRSRDDRGQILAKSLDPGAPSSE